MNKKYNAFLENCNGSDEDRAVKMFNDMKRKEIEMDNTIEKAMSKTAQVNKVLNEVAGEVTPETVLNQCISMTNNKITADFNYVGYIHAFSVSVYSVDDLKGYKPFYNKVHHTTLPSISLAEIYQDLIKIEEGEMK